MISIDQADTAHVLDSCAGRLLAASRVDLPDPGVALYCLQAADLLRARGAQPDHVEIAGRAADAIRSILADLARLPAAEFVNPAVADAAAATRRALRCAQLEMDSDLAPDAGPLP